MLCQLVCIDRRYQRMNCFNIRELQSILKRRFFTDLINSTDHHILLNKSLLTLRHKINNTTNLTPDIHTFYTLNLSSDFKTKTLVFVNTYFNGTFELTKFT
jgi:hypothetical protein